MNSTRHHPAGILLVDDDTELLKALAKLLETEGYDVLDLPSCDAAMKYIQRSSQRFDLAITDVSMTGMSGIEFLREFKERYPAVPVVIITAFGSWGQYKDALKYGAFDYINKPLDIAEFLTTVRRALGQNGASAPNILAPA